ncbi:FAD-dependent oxidoreductase [Pendulispora brunnea]|uniref:FAD-dependent oxidoreductase n=1 Tax=Pendulispora brunnea TaxID=2905690 RepID=A0ABZ2KRD3_9BACT
MPQLRIANVQRLGETDFDVLVVGGGINGAVSAACLSARGAKVALIDKGDFAGFTSQQSSNLAWGGIKYMETMEFGLVRKLCMSRNHLIRSYPSTVQEIRFFAAHPRGFRHGLWKLYLGAWIYWFIGSLFTKKPRLLPQGKMAREEPVINLDVADGGFEYSDAFLHDNDARFVFNFVRGALNYGCVAANYVESRGSEYDKSSGIWLTRAKDVSGSRTHGRDITIRSRVVINACGPYVDSMNERAGEDTSHHHVFSKGIHLIVDRITPHRRVLTMFADDGRPFFVIPMGPRSCIGTTDTRVDRPETHVTEEDRRFVLDNINKRLKLKKPLTEADIIAERCGVRPLAVTSKGNGGTDWTQLSRKHAIEVDRERRHISIFGGKLTDCLNVGEEIAEEVQSLGVSFPYPQARWYGEPPDETHREFLHQARLMNLDGMTPPSSSEKLTSRLWRRYGAEALGLLEDIRADPRMAELVVEGAEYLRCEIAQAARREMIVKLDDFLRRRSKIALVIHKDVLRDAPGLREACEILFGADADRRFEEYFAEDVKYPASA